MFRRGGPQTPESVIMQLLPRPQHCDLQAGQGPCAATYLRRAVTIDGRPTAELVHRQDDSWLADYPDCPPACREQAYRLHLGHHGIVISATTDAGWRHGLATLAQMLEQTPDGVHLPGGTIDDFPVLCWRGLQYDIARGMTYRHEHLKQVIRDLAAMKLNLLHLYLEGRFAYPSHPELHTPGLMTPEEAEDLTAFARKCGVMLVPQVNCLGHMANILDQDEHAHLREDPGDPYMICPSHPESLPFVLSLVDDLADCFDPPFVHIGMDEVGKLGHCPTCRERLAAAGHAGGLIADHINAIAAHLRARGIRPMIWGDMLLDLAQFPGTHAANGGVTGWGSRNCTARALDTLDRGVVICDWQYARFSPAEHAHLRDLGFDIMPALDTDERVCPWGPERGLDEHLPAFFESCRQNEALGGYACTWSLRLGEVFDNRWLDFAKTAECAWTGGCYEPEPFVERFARAFLGLEEPLLRRIDRIVKTDIVPPAVHLLSRIMKLDAPWAAIEPPPGHTAAPSPKGGVARMVALKEEGLLWLARAREQATRRVHWLAWLDLPLGVDLLVLRMFALKDVIRHAYRYAHEHPDDTQVANWCREAILTSLAGLAGQAERLGERFGPLWAQLGNDADNIEKTAHFGCLLRDMQNRLGTASGLPDADVWCPAALRPGT
jgi:hypothetical protein